MRSTGLPSSAPVKWRTRFTGSGVLILALTFGINTSSTLSAADKAAIKQAVARGATYLATIQPDLMEGRLALCTYAMLKAGRSPGDPGTAKAIAGILKRCEGDAYTPNRGDQIYSSGVEAMILADVDPEAYQPQLQKIASYLMSVQRDDGSFSYRNPTEPGDTSVTQYATLGLWACARAGVEIPAQVWDRIAEWHVKSQMSDGAFQYCPGASAGVTGANPNLTMTAAGAATMSIVAMYLYPEQSSIQDRPGPIAESKAQSQPGDPNDPLGVLNVRRSDPNAPKTAIAGPYKPQIPFAEIQQHVRAAVGWASNNFTSEYRLDLRMYNYYTLERMGALTGVEELGGRNWFDECAGRLLATQADDGSWTTSIYDAGVSHPVGTSFAILFLTQSTAKLINRLPPEDAIGGGLQAGGRGLPDDLSTVKMLDGRVAEEKSLGELDHLLKSLESAASNDLFNLQTQIVKKIQLGDRSELIGQTDRLIELVENPSPEIRRVALWALARSDNLKLARYAVAALEDPDADVLVEAHNALCWLSRRPNAFDIPPTPHEGLPPDATAEQKQQAVEKWRANARQRWGTWYLRMCTYEEKNTPFAIDLAHDIGVR